MIVQDVEATAGGQVIPLPRLSEPRLPVQLQQFEHGQAGREPLEDFVRRVFARSYGAHITTFYPRLIGLTHADGSFAAVAGIRPAADARLFAEHYLDLRIEAAIQERSGLSVARPSIVEVGNLAPANAGQARWLIATLTAYLHACGFRWVVFTAVPALHNAFTRMGLRPWVLGSARIERLGAGHQDDWGSYYLAGPQVYAGDIQQGFQALHPLINDDMPQLHALWQRARQMGLMQVRFLDAGYPLAGVHA